MDLQQYKAEDFVLNDSFVRYCLRSNDSDIQFWEDWLARNPHKAEEAAVAKGLVFRLGLRLTPEEKEQAFVRLQAGIAASGAVMPERKPFFRRLWWRIAAAVILPAVVAAGWYFRQQHTTTAITAAYRTWHAQQGHRLEIQLADGTRVLLNHNSILKVDTLSYNRQHREVQLTGEAWFEVAKQDGRPFTVAADDIRILALGTAFRVRAYTADSTRAVALLEGKVRVSGREQRELIPGQQLIAASNGFQVNNFDREAETNKLQGRLVFSNATLEDIARSLQEWYGVRVQIKKGAYKPIRFNGIFRDKPIEEVSTAIAFVNSLKINISEQKDTIYISNAK